MTKARQSERSIEPRREYNIRAMIDADVFPWIRASERHKYREYAEIIAKDYLGDNMLGAVRIPHGQRSEYLIKGRALIEFIKVYGPGLKLAKQRIWKQKRS